MSLDEIEELLETIRHFKEMRKTVVDWMNAEGAAGRLRQNQDCPQWLAYKRAEEAFGRAIAHVT